MELSYVLAVCDCIHTLDNVMMDATLFQFSTHFGYMLEVGSHWISSYFLGDDMRLPSTPEAALEETERQSAWLRHRYPQVSPTANTSHTSNIGFWG